MWNWRRKTSGRPEARTTSSPSNWYRDCLSSWIRIRAAWRRAQLTPDERNRLEDHAAEVRRRAATSEMYRNLVFTGSHMPGASADPTVGVSWEAWASTTAREEGAPTWEQNEAPMGFRKEDWPIVREQLKAWRGGPPPPPSGASLFRRTRLPASIEFDWTFVNRGPRRTGGGR